jgi:hypothetical protein
VLGWLLLAAKHRPLRRLEQGQACDIDGARSMPPIYGSEAALWRGAIRPYTA